MDHNFHITGTTHGEVVFKYLTVRFPIATTFRIATETNPRITAGGEAGSGRGFPGGATAQPRGRSVQRSLMTARRPSGVGHFVSDSERSGRSARKPHRPQPVGAGPFRAAAVQGGGRSGRGATALLVTLHVGCLSYASSHVALLRILSNACCTCACMVISADALMAV